jgi:hypothetical protein
MAGKNPSNPSFGKDFRRNIRFVMNMGAPPLTEERATFYFANVLVYQSPDDAADTDASGTPFDPSIPVTMTRPDPVQVPCSVEYFDAEGVPTDFGIVTPSRAAITLLDEDYKKVKECAYVVLGGDKFVYRRTQSPDGLFDVGLYTMHFVSENDT